MPRRWRSIRRAAALLIKAAAAAASGELLPCPARAYGAAFRRELPSTLNFLQVTSGSLIVLPPAAELLQLLNVGAGKRHSRVRFFIASLHANFLKSSDGISCMIWLDYGSFWP